VKKRCRNLSKKNSRSCQTNFQQSVRIPTSIVDRNPRYSLAIANSSFCGGGTSDPAAIAYRCSSEVPASNSYRRLPDFSKRFIYRDATPESSSNQVQDKVEFHFTSDDVYYTIIITLSNIPFMLRCCRCTSCQNAGSHNTDFTQPVLRRCRSISTSVCFCY
jgi:hypothetical protein